MKKIAYIILILLIIIVFVLIYVRLKSSKIQQQPPITTKEQPPITTKEQPQIIKKEEPVIIVCPEIENKYYTFLPDAMLGKDIIKGLSQFIKMFIRPMREMFVPLVNFMSDTSKISATNNYIVGDINQAGLNAIPNANLGTKNGGTICTSSLPNKIYFELKQPTQPVIDFCDNIWKSNTIINRFYPTTKQISINVGDTINQNYINLEPSTKNTCIYDIMYNYNGAIPNGKVGRYILIYISLPGAYKVENNLSIAEIQAFDIYGTNVALGKPVYTSSIVAGFPGSNVVDGNLNTICQTNDKCPWLYVDLGEDIVITSIKVFNRPDCCQDKLLGYRLSLIRTANTSTMLTALSKPVYNSWPIISLTGTTYNYSWIISLSSTFLSYSTIFFTSASDTSMLVFTYNLSIAK